MLMSTTAPAPARGGGRLLDRLRYRGARRWYFGSVFGLAYQIIELITLWSSNGETWLKVTATGLLLVVYAIYVLLPPLIWAESVRVRIIALLLYWTFSCALFPLIGPSTIWVWTLLAAIIGFTWIPFRAALLFEAAIVAVQFGIAASTSFDSSIAFAPFVTASVGVSTIAFARQIVQNQQLRLAHVEIARLAVNEERARLARDLHDSLGHSLTVVAVKSELAGKLVARDPERAAAEIADIEKLARDGLGELRAAVAGYRDTDLDVELDSARTALTAAGITAHLPPDGSAVEPELRTLFGWVVREGVTNVIRHSRARSCWIELTASSVRVRDDGRAEPSRAAQQPGNGLRGLRERASAFDARVTAASRDGGGFELEVAR